MRAADILLVDGGDPVFLCRWLRASGLADLLPTLPDLVWVGMSAGSMAHAGRWADDIAGPAYAMDDQSALRVVDGVVAVVSEGQWVRFGPPP